MSDHPWWQKATAYQIWPRSFQDSDGDGIGDLPGIIDRLDHLADLGIGFIWLSPVYRSPMADMGYDISDYQDIDPTFGTLADMDRLVAEARARGIGVVMDLVVNHTSDRHAWFEESRSSRDNPRRGWYVWRDPAPDGGPPNGLQSFFGGSAWEWDEATRQYYLHLFDRSQPDLDWTNPEMRAAVHAMMNWWLDRGIAGFRMDVIDLIGKEPDRGITADGPTLHALIREMHEATLAGRDVVTVGEAWSATTANALLYSGRSAGELSMVFQFEHVVQGWHETHGKWGHRDFDLVAFKAVFDKWQAALAEDGWNSLFWGNHDLPRAVSRYGHAGEHRVASAKMLATILHLMKGTPYVYQGEEIGMTNAAFDRIDQFRDVETLNYYEIQVAAGVPAADFLAGANRNGRDNARTPMQWSDAPHGGFTTADLPWIEVNRNHPEINVARDRADPDGIFEHYRRLIALRREMDLVSHGSHEPVAADHPKVWAYVRRHGGERLSVLANVSDSVTAFEVPEALAVEGRCLVHTHGPRDALAGTVTLRPYEAVAILAA